MLDVDDSYSPGDRVLLCDGTEGWTEGEVLEQRDGRLLVYWRIPRLQMRCVGWLPVGRVERLEGRRVAG